MMESVKVLRNSFNLLKGRPEIFLPKIFENLVFSFIWLYLANILVNPLEATLLEVVSLAGVMLLMAPIHIWFFTSYILMVDLFDKDDFSMKKAFKQGLKKFPQTAATMVFSVVLAIVASLPGGLITFYGISIHESVVTLLGFEFHSWFFIILGYIWVGIAIFTVFILSYLAPASVITGKETFKENLKEGYKASNKLRRIISVLTIFTFGLLGLTMLLEGVLRGIGIFGYLFFRAIYAVVNVYVLIINPSLLITAKNMDDVGTVNG